MMSWSKQDTEAFQQIVTKAKNCGVLESLCEGQQVIHAGSPSSQFSMVSSVQVSMTDAAKRRASVEIEQLQQSSIPGGSNSMCTGYANRKGSAEVNQPVYHDETAVTEKIKLPPGVPDFETWGKTRIDFGKYMGHNMSYVQLARSLSPECTKYKTWCIQRNPPKVCSRISQIFLWSIRRSKVRSMVCLVLACPSFQAPIAYVSCSTDEDQSFVMPCSATR